MPISFFLSSIAAGTALIILTEMWIAKGWERQLRVPQLAAMGQITFWSLLAYLAFRLGDMAIRGQFAGAFSGQRGALFAAEIFLGGSCLWRYFPAQHIELDLECCFSGRCSLRAA